MKKLFLFAMLWLFANMAEAAWPTQNITLIVTNPPGALNDQIARIIAEDMEQEFKVGVSVLNMPGANFSSAKNYITDRKNDNHTFMMVWDNACCIYTDSQIDIMAKIYSAPLVLVGNKESSITKLKDQIKNHATVNVATLQVDTIYDLWARSLKSDLNINPIPFNGGVPAITSTIGGHTDYAVISVPLTKEYMESGMLKPMMVATRARVPLMPNVPTYAELGFSGVPAQFWGGVAAKNDISHEATNTFLYTISKIISTDRRIKKLEEIGVNFKLLNHNDTQKSINDEIKNMQLIKSKIIYK